MSGNNDDASASRATRSSPIFLSTAALIVLTTTVFRDVNLIAPPSSSSLSLRRTTTRQEQFNLTADLNGSTPALGHVEESFLATLKSRAPGLLASKSSLHNTLQDADDFDVQQSSSPLQAADDSTSDENLKPKDEAPIQVIQSRSFPHWPTRENETMACGKPLPAWSRAPARTGYLLVKTYKTGSSVAASVNLRVARHIALRQQADICSSRSNHVLASEKYWRRNRTTSFLWSTVREPTSRIVSQFFHMKVSKKGVSPTLENLQEYIQKVSRSKDYYLQSLSLSKYNETATDEQKQQVANQMLTDYDFIAVTERMHESFVALSMLLRLPLSAFLYLPVKRKGGYDALCNYLVPSVLTPDMQAYLELDEWQERSKWDQAIHAAANSSLDRTIDETLGGRAAFETRLAVYERALVIANERCRPKTVFPCSDDGSTHTPQKDTDCLFSDSGCGFECLDQIALDLGLDD